MFLNMSCNAIELSCLDKDAIIELNDISRNLLNQFKFKSLHAPGLGFEYKNNKQTRAVLDQLKKFHQIYNFDSISFHPDLIRHQDVFNDYKDTPITLENMDCRKDTGRTVEQMKKFFEDNNFKFLLDIQHCYVNDNSLDLVNDMYNNFKDRLIEYHISGTKDKKHNLLYKQNQNKIIEAVFNIDIPIIIESPVESIDQLEFELKYILANID